ncbi:MAG: ATP-binding protein [Beijerinckiaceae bacterium]|nr:ATP-binding protein [Beijerinckiaceae bacterium]
MSSRAPGIGQSDESGPAGARWSRASFALVVVSILLPLVLFGLAAWQNRRDVLRAAETRVERTTRILHEHALKVFETHQLMLSYIDERLFGFDWSNEAGREALHLFLARLRQDAVQVNAITITDSEGRLRATSQDISGDSLLEYADRDYFQVLKARDQPLPYVSQSVTGRQSGEPVFNIAQRIRGANAGLFDGVIVISVKRAYFEDFYRGIEREYNHLVILTREDGSVLAREPPDGMAALAPKSPFRLALESSSTSFFVTPVMIDGKRRIFGYEKIGGFPVAIGFGVTWDSVLAAWWRNIITYGFVAFLSSVALLLVSWVAMRHSASEVRATRRWRDTAALLQSEMGERLRVEDQLRQVQKMEAVGRLTGGVAHDFNNLLTIVIGSLDLLSRRLSDGDPRHQVLVRNAMDGATRAAALTARLLAFARQHPLDPKPISPNALLGGMLNLLQHSLGEEVEVEIIPAYNLWSIFVDPNQLENAILNLSVNARDAMPEGGGTLKIETANVTIDAAYTVTHPEAAAGQYVAITVTDSGTGMTPDVLSHAFEPFYTTKPVGKGTGLGLSQVYGFTKQSGGFAEIESELGKGTSIRIFLPRLQNDLAVEVPADATDSTASPMPRENRSILLVEDEDLVRQFSTEALREAGYTVLEAATASDAVDLLRRHPEVALLFTDIVLKGAMNGRALARQALALRPELKVLFTSGYRSESGVSYSGAGDAGDFLPKPFTTAALAAKIEVLLG